MAEKPPAEFQKISDPAESRTLLIESARTLAPAMLWTKDQKWTLKTHITQIDEKYNNLFVWVPTQTDPEETNDLLLSMQDRSIFFSVSLSRANIFFKAEYRGWESDGFKFHSPDRVFKVQRRAFMRHAIPSGYTLKVAFEDPFLKENILHRKVFDLSAGGMSVLLETADVGLFEKGTVLKGVEFTVNSKKIKCDAEIKHIHLNPPSQNNHVGRLGIEFLGLREADRQVIAMYVFEESRRIYTRFI